MFCAVQAVVTAFGCWEAEWEFMEKMLQEDLRNNSAWAQRAFLVVHRVVSCVHCAAVAAGAPIRERTCASLGDDGSGAFLQMTAAMIDQDAVTREDAGSDGKSSPCLGHNRSGGVAARTQRIEFVSQCIQKELEFTASRAHEMPHNESAWNYLCGLASLLSIALSQCLTPEAAEDVLQKTLNSNAAASMGSSIEDRSHSTPVIDAQAEAFLAGLPEDVRRDVERAACAALQGIFTITFAVLDACPGCIPARVALLKAYVLAVGMATESCDVQRARDAAAVLADGLSIADPLRKGWYTALVSSLPNNPSSS
jgi:hypothetical protein